MKETGAFGVLYDRWRSSVPENLMRRYKARIIYRACWTGKKHVNIIRSINENSEMHDWHCGKTNQLEINAFTGY